MEREYAAHYRHLYEHHWWWRARERIIVSHLRRLCPRGGFGPILDVGCGDGLFFERLEAFGHPEGVESDAGLVTGGGPRRGHIHVGPFDETFQPGKRYRLILMLDMLEHAADDRAALRRALALLTPDGLVIITVPAFRALWTAHDDVNRHLTRYTKRSLRGLAADTGLRIEHSQYLFQWTAVVKLAVRAKEAVIRRPPGLPRVPGRRVNEVLLRAALLEHGVLRRVPVPFGSSLLVVARRPRS